MIETTLLPAPDRWAPVSAPDPAPLLEQLATLRLENAALRTENAIIKRIGVLSWRVCGPRGRRVRSRHLSTVLQGGEAEDLRANGIQPVPSSLEPFWFAAHTVPSPITPVARVKCVCELCANGAKQGDTGQNTAAELAS